MITPKERAQWVGQNCTGPIHVTRYASDNLEFAIEDAITNAVGVAVQELTQRYEKILDGICAAVDNDMVSRDGLRTAISIWRQGAK